MISTVDGIYKLLRRSSLRTKVERFVTIVKLRGLDVLYDLKKHRMLGAHWTFTPNTPDVEVYNLLRVASRVAVLLGAELEVINNIDKGYKVLRNVAADVGTPRKIGNMEAWARRMRAFRLAVQVSPVSTERAKKIRRLIRSQDSRALFEFVVYEESSQDDQAKGELIEGLSDILVENETSTSQAAGRELQAASSVHSD